MTATAARRIRATITLHADGRTEIAVVLVESDGTRTGLTVPPLAHPDALEGFIYALAARHQVAADAVEIGIDDRRAPFQHTHRGSDRLH